jgi:hypothetical protein
MKHHLLSFASALVVFLLVLYFFQAGRELPAGADPAAKSYSPGEHPCTQLAQACRTGEKLSQQELHNHRRQCFREIFLTKKYGDIVFSDQVVEACLSFRRQMSRRSRPPADNSASVE